MASRTDNAAQAQDIIKRAEETQAFNGIPGQLSPSEHLPSIARSLKGIKPLSSELNLGEALLVRNALLRANADAPVMTAVPHPPLPAKEAITVRAAVATPGLGDILDEVLKGLKVIGTTADDIKTFVNGTTATLKWWGWTISLTEEATLSLIRVLDNDLPSLLTVAAALLTSVPALTAIAAILKIVEVALVAWINAEDKAQHHGVTIHGYLWIAVVVEPNK
jgi:hypothetical protein